MENNTLVEIDEDVRKTGRIIHAIEMNGGFYKKPLCSVMSFDLRQEAKDSGETAIDSSALIVMNRERE
jgi:hypothetical protein